MATSSRRLARIVSHLEPAVASELAVCAAPVAADASSGTGIAGEVAIITGSGQGIGAAAARLFAAHGAKVVVTDLDKAKSDAVAASIVSAGGAAISVPGDVTDPKFPDRLMAATIDAFGKLNHIVNNAGYTWDGTLHRMSDKQWQAMLDVHNTAPFRIIRAATPYMREAGKREMKETGRAANRSITNVSSTSGLHGNFGQANYSTAKMGIVGLTKTVAKEWGPYGVRCNAVAFGFVTTRLTQAKEKGGFIQVGSEKIALGIPMGTANANDPKVKAAQKASMRNIPLRRPGHPDEAAGSLLMLSSPLCSYVTGHTLECTGGAGI